MGGQIYTYIYIYIYMKYITSERLSRVGLHIHIYIFKSKFFLVVTDRTARQK
jgi:hypothetical protein